MPQRLTQVSSYVRRSPKRVAEDSKAHAELRAAQALDEAFPEFVQELSRLVEDAVAMEGLH